MATRIDLFRKNTTTIPGRKLSQNDNRQIGRLPLPAAVYSRFAAVILRLYLEMDNTRLHYCTTVIDKGERERGYNQHCVLRSIVSLCCFFFLNFFSFFPQYPTCSLQPEAIIRFTGIIVDGSGCAAPLPSLGDTANHLPSSPSVIVTNITEVWPRGSGGLTNQKTHTIAAGLNDTPSHFVRTSLWQITMAGDAT